MSNRRENLLNQLEKAAAKEPFVPEDFTSLSFQIMYGLPTELQLRAALHVCERYLPIFERKWPDLAWCRQLISDIDAWHRTEGEGTPDVPHEADSAVSAYYFGFIHLLCGYHNKDNPEVLTAGVCGTIFDAVCARAINVYLADDAVAARIEQDKAAYHRMKDAHHRNEDGSYREEEEDYPPEPAYFSDLWKPEHNRSLNAAYEAVYRREWRHVVGWLRTEKVWNYPEPADMEAMTRGLKRWEAHEFYPMGPERKEPE